MFGPRHGRRDDEDTVEVLVGQPGWAVSGPVATYAPVGGGWSARVGSVVVAGKVYRRWHVAIIDGRGRAQFTMLVATVAEARRVAERHVDGRNVDAG